MTHRPALSALVHNLQIINCLALLKVIAKCLLHLAKLDPLAAHGASVALVLVLLHELMLPVHGVADAPHDGVGGGVGGGGRGGGQGCAWTRVTTETLRCW